MKFNYTTIILILFISCGQQQNSAETQAYIHKIVVEEVLQTSSYTYLLAEENGARQWLATLKLDLSVGDIFYYKGGLDMVNFNSKELDKTFDSVLFLEGLYTSEAMLLGEKNMTGSPEITNSATSIISSIIEPADGGISIAELMANKSSYGDKKVKLRGKVVKYNAGIMNKNWIHLQDGTSNGEENDIVITTEVSARVGDIITVEGIITLDKDFGAGYFYKIIMEEGVIIDQII
jgi:hypothetical protein